MVIDRIIYESGQKGGVARFYAGDLVVTVELPDGFKRTPSAWQLWNGAINALHAQGGNYQELLDWDIAAARVRVRWRR